MTRRDSEQHCKLFILPSQRGHISSLLLLSLIKCRKNDVIIAVVTQKSISRTRSYYTKNDKKTALSAMPHLVSGENFLRNFATLLLMTVPVTVSSSFSHQFIIIIVIITSTHYASLHLCSTPDSKILPTIVSLTISDGSHGFLWPFPDLIAHRLLFCFSLFIFFLFDSCDRLSWFNQFLNCRLKNKSLHTPFLFLSEID